MRKAQGRGREKHAEKYCFRGLGNALDVLMTVFCISKLFCQTCCDISWSGVGNSCFDDVGAVKAC
jgi:hypothetical protein